MSSFRVISSDNHIVEPPDLWTSRIEAKYRDRCPQLVDVEGGQAWVCDKKRTTSTTQGTQPGVRYEDPEKLKAVDTFDNVRPGGYIPQEHLKDQDADGVDVSIVYPSVGLLLYGLVSDSGLLTAIFRAYNDFTAEFCSADPKRLGGIAMINLDDVQEGISELERCANLGFFGAMITVLPPVGRTYDSQEYEPVWASAQDLGIPLSLHGATNRVGSETQAFQSGGDFAAASRPAHVVQLDYGVRMSLTDLIFTGVLERYPKLQVGAIEHELSWVPHLLDRLDYNYDQRAFGQAGYRFKNAMVPSDFFHRNVFLSFQEDGLGIRLRDIIGVDGLLWAADYPHQEGTFPYSRQVLEKILSDCTEEERAKIAGGNAARVYNL